MKREPWPLNAVRRDALSRRSPVLLAFTLLELVLVLVIIAIALAAVTPSLGGWSRGMKLRAASDELLAATRMARDRAVTTATPHALMVIEHGAGWRVVPAEALHDQADLGAELTHALPSGWRFELASIDGTPMEQVMFHPDGRGDAAMLQLTDDHGDRSVFIRESTVSGFVRESEASP